MDAFTTKSGDTSPSLRYDLIPDDQTIEGATVRFQMRRRNGPVVIDAPGTIVSALPPVVQYNWQPGDTDTPGLYDAEFRVEYMDGAVETYPNVGFISVNIGSDVPGAGQ